MNEQSITATVSSDENVARLISSEWIQEGILQPVAFTLDVYGHVTDKMKRDSADRMQKFIDSISV